MVSELTETLANGEDAPPYRILGAQAFESRRDTRNAEGQPPGVSRQLKLGRAPTNDAKLPQH